MASVISTVCIKEIQGNRFWREVRGSESSSYISGVSGVDYCNCCNRKLTVDYFRTVTSHCVTFGIKSALHLVKSLFYSFPFFYALFLNFNFEIIIGVTLPVSRIYSSYSVWLSQQPISV